MRTSALIPSIRPRRLRGWRILKKLPAHASRRGTTILLTTHYLEEAEQFCDRIAIINHGKVIACDTTEALLSRLDSNDLTLILAEDLTEVPAELSGFHVEIAGPPHLVLPYRPSQRPVPEVLRAAAQAGPSLGDRPTG